MNNTPVKRLVPSIDHQLTAVNQLIARHEFTAAIQQAEVLAQTTQAKIPALALLALAAALAGERDKALTALQKIGDPSNCNKAEVLLAAGSAWFKLGQMFESVRFLKAGLALNAEHPLINARLGAGLLALGRTEEALPLLERTTVLIPDSGGAWLNLARACLERGEHERALAALDRAEPLGDKEEDIYRLTRADALTRAGRGDEAELLLRTAAETLLPGPVANLVELLGSRGKHDEAWQILREALEKSPQESSLLELAAELAQVLGRFGEADRYLNRALQVDPDNAALWRRRAMNASRRLGVEQAAEAAEKALALTVEKGGIQHALSLATQAQVLGEMAKYDESEAGYRQALALHAHCVPALNGLGHLLMQLGRVDEATASFEQLKKIAPMQGWSQLIHARQIPDNIEVLERMALAARRPSLDGPVQAHLLFTLAAAWERKKDYEQAWAFAAEGNLASKTRLRYRPEHHRRRVEREIERFSAEFMHSRQGFGDPSSLPVFVLGMPRSGTTLVEQILGSHSQVFGAGELSLVPELIQKLNAWEMKLGSRREYPECIDEMTAVESQRFAEKHLTELRAYAPEATRIVDKLPHNFEHIGLIKLMFPNARILHMKREPRDVAMSNFFTDYSAKFGGMGFAYDLSWIGEQLVDHERLLVHWHTVFPGQILDVDYDELVEDVEGWARKIIDYLNLPWEEGVLSFQELDRAVKTASVWQVRQPVYKTSKAKWKHYEQHLQPLEAVLAEVPPLPAPAPLPVLPPGLFLQGMNLLQIGNITEAETVFRQLITARNTHAAGHHFLGAALYQQGLLEEARKEMRRSLELQDGQRQWLENLIKVEDALGNTDEVERLRDRLKRNVNAAAITPSTTT